MSEPTPLLPFAHIDGSPNWDGINVQCALLAMCDYAREDKFREIILLSSDPVQLVRFDLNRDRPPGDDRLLPNFAIVKNRGAWYFISDGTVTWGQLWNDVTGFAIRKGFAGDPNVWAHGFFVYLAERALTYLAAEIAQIVDGEPLRFSGHSLGAAVVFLLSCLAKRAFPHSPVECVTFGEPRSLGQDYKGPQPDVHFRIVNFAGNLIVDPVTQLPPADLEELYGIVPRTIPFLTKYASYYHYGTYKGITNSGLTYDSAPTTQRRYLPNTQWTMYETQPHAYSSYISSLAGVYNANGGSAPCAAALAIATNVINSSEEADAYRNLPDPQRWLDLAESNRAAGLPPFTIDLSNWRLIDTVSMRQGVLSPVAPAGSFTGSGPMAQHLVTFTFNDENQGWREQFHVSYGNAFLVANHPALYGYLGVRAPMMGKTVKLVSIATVNEANSRLGDYLSGEKVPDAIFKNKLNSTLDTADSNICLQSELFNTGFTQSRTMYVRGWPFAWIGNRLEGGLWPAGNNKGKDQFDAWSNYLLVPTDGVAWQIRSRNSGPGGPPLQTILDISAPTPPGNVVITVGTANIFAVGQLVLIRDVRGAGTQGINGIRRVIARDTAGLVYTLSARKCSACPFDFKNKGTARVLDFIYDTITAVNPIRWTTKKCGGPFASRPGRTPKPCCG